jgi:putative transposase
MAWLSFPEKAFEPEFEIALRACLKSRMRGHVIVGVMTISTDVDKLYDTDLTDAAWALIAPMLPAARPGGRPRKINIRAVLNAIFYLLRTGCQWRLLPREFPGWSTVYHYFRAWKNAGVWTCIQRSMYQQARGQAGRAACPSVVIMDGQSVKTTERGGIRGFDAHKRVTGRKRHILVDTPRAADRMQSGAG